MVLQKDKVTHCRPFVISR